MASGSTSIQAAAITTRPQTATHSVTLGGSEVMVRSTMATGARAARRKFRCPCSRFGPPGTAMTRLQTQIAAATTRRRVHALEGLEHRRRGEDRDRDERDPLQLRIVHQLGCGAAGRSRGDVGRNRQPRVEPLGVVLEEPATAVDRGRQERRRGRCKPLLEEHREVRCVVPPQRQQGQRLLRA